MQNNTLLVYIYTYKYILLISCWHDRHKFQEGVISGEIWEGKNKLLLSALKRQERSKVNVGKC